MRTQKVLQTHFSFHCRLSILFLLIVGLSSCNLKEDQQPNVLLITVDDMNWNSVGSYGCNIDNITPNIDRLAAEGMQFNNAYVNFSICSPSRSCMMTGYYAHQHGMVAENGIHDTITTLSRRLNEAGYLTGIMGKTFHYLPVSRYNWDEFIRYDAMKGGRVPAEYYAQTDSFIKKANGLNKPFFLSANISDPHEPFAKKGETRKGHVQPINRFIQPDETDMLGFVPDIPEIRKLVARYYTSVFRADECLGEILRALKSNDCEENTIVVFLSDHGAPFPFAKHSSYYHSHKTPLIMRWPGKIQANSKTEALVESIDLMPTILDMTAMEAGQKKQGISLWPLLQGKQQKTKAAVFGAYSYHSVPKSRSIEPFPERTIQNKEYRYIINFWAYEADYSIKQGILSSAHDVMVEKAPENAAVKKRLRFYEYRPKEELYHIRKDPDCLHNLIGDDRHREALTQLREKMLELMKATRDPAYEAFKTRNQEQVQEFMQERHRHADEFYPKRRELVRQARNYDK